MSYASTAVVMSEGSLQDTKSALSSPLTESMIGAGKAGVPTSVPDHVPSPLELTARTCTSYGVPLSRPMMVYSSVPEVQALSTTVQLASTVSSALVSM